MKLAMKGLLKVINEPENYHNLKEIFFFYLGFLAHTFTNRRTVREGGNHFLNSFLILPPFLQTLSHLPDHYCRELVFAYIICGWTRTGNP